LPESPREPLILDIKGNSLDDGPGIRTVVFFKGCPLDCSWCHNPESKLARAELSFDEKECVACDSCLQVCECGALDRGQAGFVDRVRCDLCGACARECPSGALTVVGRRMSVEDIACVVEKDRPFFETSGGGVTMSGGEPTMFIDYCSRLLARLHGEGIHTIVETCGQFDLEEFARAIVPHTDAVYFDLKLLDEDLHRLECGTSNEKILENFRSLAARYPEGGSGPELLARIPLIPGITATSSNLSSLAAFLRESGARRVALLPYNPLWTDKTRNLGKPGPAPGDRRMDSWMDKSELSESRAMFEGLELV
jgi:pyruvate formate lyase activating enzyme